MVRYSHLFKNFPQFVVIHTVKGFSEVNEEEADGFFFWNSFAYSMIQQMLVIWHLVPLSFLNPACTSGSSRFIYCWSLAWGILSIILLACEMSNFISNYCNCTVIWILFGIIFLWDWNENWPFPVLWPLLNFPDLLAYWVQHFHSIIF